MRHGINGRKLNRTSSHRKALFKNLSNSLILNEQIKTTVFKAKDLRPIIEKIITIGKKDDIHSKRQLFSILRDQKSVTKVCNILSKRFLKRPGGYTRIVKAGYRYGDASPMAIIEFLDRDINAKGLVDRERIRIEEQSKKGDNIENNLKKDELSEKKVTIDKKSIKDQKLKE